MREAQAPGPGFKDMQAKIGQLTLENDFLEVALGRMGDARRGILHSASAADGGMNQFKYPPTLGSCISNPAGNPLKKRQILS